MTSNLRQKRPREVERLKYHGLSSDDEMFESCNEGELSEVGEPQFKCISVSDRVGLEQHAGESAGLASPKSCDK